jgi:hypothetical protein
MGTYRVVVDGSGWAVKKNGRRVFQKTYATKQAAVDAAFRTADVGDSVQAQRARDGTFGPERTVGTQGPRGDR